MPNQWYKRVDPLDLIYVTKELIHLPLPLIQMSSFTWPYIWYKCWYTWPYIDTIVNTPEFTCDTRVNTPDLAYDTRIDEPELTYDTRELIYFSLLMIQKNDMSELTYDARGLIYLSLQMIHKRWYITSELTCDASCL